MDKYVGKISKLQMGKSNVGGRVARDHTMNQSFKVTPANINDDIRLREVPLRQSHRVDLRDQSSKDGKLIRPDDSKKGSTILT